MKRRTLLTLTLGACVGIGGLAQAQNLANAQDKAELKATINNCSVCHGINGHSVSPTFPNLAAQQPVYIENQLKAFKDHTRGDPNAQAFMWGMASGLSDQMIGQVAEYFASQPPPPPEKGDPKLIAEGHHIFTHGIPAEGSPRAQAVMGRTRRVAGCFRASRVSTRSTC